MMQSSLSSPDQAVSPEEKRLALQRVLGSQALGRSEQLRVFLRYVCETEFEGRGHEINEYAVGVHALGRATDYSPAEDSCVRTRAHELRHRMRNYYESEAPEDPVRIQIRKGGYLPRFSRTPPQREGVEGQGSQGSFATPELEALWRPFMDSDAPLLIVFDVQLFLFAPERGLVVRDCHTNSAADVGTSVPLNAFKRQTGTRELIERREYSDFGAVHAAFALGKALGDRQGQVALKHAHSLDWQDVWNSNVVFLGKPDTSPVIASLLESGPFMQRPGYIENLQPVAGEAGRYHCTPDHGAGVKHALVTRLPSPSTGRHLLMLTGEGAELMWALGESVTNPEYANKFMPSLRSADGSFPSSFQAVIRTEFQSNVPLRISPVAHRPLQG